jgi:hypothetical protein
MMTVDELNDIVVCKLVPPVVHPNLSKTHDGMSQNFVSQKGGNEIIHGHKYVSTYKSMETR